MADQQQHAPGGHYSGHNKIPTVNQFIEKLDRDKKDRDRQIDEQRSAKPSGEAVAHQNLAHPKENQKTVTDPTTGKEIIIEDVNQEMVDAAKNPQISVPNQALGKDTVRWSCHYHTQDMRLTAHRRSKSTPLCRTTSTRRRWTTWLPPA